MKNILLVVFLIFFTSLNVIGQNTSTPDSLYNKIIQKYKTEYDKVDHENRAKLDSIAALRSLELEKLYNMYPESNSGKEGLVLAFRGWLNVDSVATMGEYVNKVSFNDDIWHELMGWYGYGLSNNQTDPYKYYGGLETILESESVNNPYSLTFLYSELGKFEMMINQNKEKAIEYFEGLIEVGVDSIEVEMAKRDLYDLNTLRVGQTIPNFSVEDINGNTIDITQYRGKYVLIEFWATWCGPCIPEVPYLKEIYSKYGDIQDFKMIGVSLDTSKDNLISFLQENDMHWTQILDTGGARKWTGKLGTLFAVGNGIPKNFLVDKEGRIIATELRKEGLDEAISEYLND